MILNFGHIFHRFSKDKSMRGMVHIPADFSSWPPSWRTIHYKIYDRFPKIHLPSPVLTVEMGTAMQNRRSARNWSTEGVSLGQLSNILHYSCGVTMRSPDPNLWRRAQASAGGRYPSEVYIINFRKGDLDEKVYHYNVKEHVLDELWDFDVSNRIESSALFSNPLIKNAGLGIFITGVIDRIIPKYGERGYRYMYYEAGGIANTINILAGTQKLGCLITGCTNDAEIEKVLDIDGTKETLLLGLVLGNIANEEINLYD